MFNKKFLVMAIVVFIIIASASFLLVSPVFGQGGGGEGPSFPNPFKNTEIDTLTEFINFILEKIVLPIGAVIAVFFIIYSGFLFVTAQGNEEKLTKAKTAFLWTAVGVLILLGSVVISNGIAETICQIGNVPGLCPNP